MHIKRSFLAELRAETREDGRLPVLRGYAAVFNSDSVDMGGWIERIAPGAFDGVMDSPDIYCLWNHDPNFIIGATHDGSLRLSQDGTGLVTDCDPMDTQTIRDLVVTPIQQGKVRKMSFAFDIAADGAEWTMENGRDVRVVRKVARLYDVSPVTYPAYPGTDISARTLAEMIRALPRSMVLRALKRTQEECEMDGGTWDSETETCSLDAASARTTQVSGDAGRTTDDAGALIEIYRRRLGRHELLASTNSERTMK